MYSIRPKDRLAAYILLLFSDRILYLCVNHSYVHINQPATALYGQLEYALTAQRLKVLQIFEL